jgi:hypothetical protein
MDIVDRLLQGRCGPGPTSDPHECELPSDECPCAIRADAAAEITRLRTTETNLESDCTRIYGEMVEIRNEVPNDFLLVPPDGGDVKTYEAVRAMAVEITRLRKERDEARAAMTWQPIETAPKDGTEILVCGPDKNGGLYRAVQRWPENWGLYWPVTYMAYAAGEPAHWMPLPTPEATK